MFNLKKKYKIALIDLFGGGVILFGLFFITKALITQVPIVIASLFLKGYQEIFKGEFGFTNYFLASLYLMGVLFFYISALLFFIIVLSTKKNTSKQIIGGYKDTFEKAFKKIRKFLFLIFTLTLSLTLMFSGILFLSVSFPAETLYIKGVNSTSGSFLKCQMGDYLNFISNYDQYCDIQLSNEFTGVVTKAKIQYSINRTIHSENLKSFDNNHVILLYNKEKQPFVLELFFNGKKTEHFLLNHKGVYTKEEYFDREKQKAIWFFAVISISVFSVFSAMSNLKNILRDK